MASNQNDNPADPFKKALTEATRVLADEPELNVSFTVDPPGMSADQMRLPQVSRRMTKQEVLLARGTADAYAMRLRYHDEGTAARYAPQGQMAREIYDAMETARCEAVGARAMPGTASNIDAKIENEASRKGYSTIIQTSEAPLAVAAGYLVRNLATGRELPAGAENVLGLWRDFIEGSCGETLGDIEDVLSDQALFAKFARQMIDDLGYGDQLGDDPDEIDDESEESSDAEEDEDDNADSTGEDDSEEQEDADANPEQSQEDQQDASEATVTLDDMADAEMADEAEMPEGDMPMEPPAPAPYSEADPE